MSIDQKRIFLTPPDGVLHQQYKSYYERFLRDLSAIPTMFVTVEQMTTLDPTQVLNKLTVLQHYPSLYERFFHGVDFKFERPGKKGQVLIGTELVNPAVIFWMQSLLSFPAAPFFVKDEDLQAFSVAGDVMVKQQFKAQQIPGKPGFSMIVDADIMNMFTERLSLSARSMQLFCYGSGIDPESAVDKLLIRMRLKLRYEMIRELLETDIAWNRSSENGSFRFN
jgi:hypothetical protein